MNEEVHAYNVHLNKKHIDTVFYGHHVHPDEVKKSLVDHDGYDSGITVTKERKKKLEEAFKTGDGRRFTTRDDAVAHANAVNKKTGNVISVEVSDIKGKKLKESEERTLREIRTIVEAAYSRKHFRQVAEIIKAHPDPKKRTELASHHSEIFTKANPRFNKQLFYSAANAKLDEKS